jgi:hypothetical protein
MQHTGDIRLKLPTTAALPSPETQSCMEDNLTLQFVDPQTIHVTPRDGEHLQGNLDKAVSLLIDKAVHHQQFGILVTRHDSASYSVALSKDVPHGQTQELDVPG